MSSSSKFPRKEKVGIVYKLDSNLCKHKSRKKEFKYALSESIESQTEEAVDNKFWPVNVNALCQLIAIRYSTNILVLENDWCLGEGFTNVKSYFFVSTGAQKLQVLKLNPPNQSCPVQKVQSSLYKLHSPSDKAHNKARLELMKSIPEKFRNRTFQLKSTDDPVLGPCNSSQDKANEAVFEDPFPNDEDLGGVLIPPTLQGPFINTSQDEFDVSKIKQPVRNINCLMAPKGKLTAKKEKNLHRSH